MKRTRLRGRESDWQKNKIMMKFCVVKIPDKSIEEEKTFDFSPFKCTEQDLSRISIWTCVKFVMWECFKP